VIVIFFLGNGCPHCIEQLNAFEPLLGDFTKAGISLVAISTDSVESLRKTFEKSKLPTKVPLLSDPGFKAFRSYRSFDEFENVPLHGTFLIDGAGLVRWQDISYEPFTEPKFLLTEAKRLLGLPVVGKSVADAR
jgi:peroxiredoxin